MISSAYTPEILGGEIAAAALDVLGWAVAGLAAAVGVMFVLLGIRKAVAWAADIVNEREPGSSGGLSSSDAWSLGVELSDPVAADLNYRWGADFDDGIAAGWGSDRASAYADKEAANLEETRIRRAGSL